LICDSLCGLDDDDLLILNPHFAAQELLPSPVDGYSLIIVFWASKCGSVAGSLNQTPTRGDNQLRRSSEVSDSETASRSLKRRRIIPRLVIVGISRDPVRLMGAQAAIWWVHSGAPLALEIKRQCEAEETSDVVSVAAGSCG
jgi:hypothetical protein